MNEFGIAGRTALVCGSSAGLGRGCARALAKVGVRVILNGRTEETLRKTAAEISHETGAPVKFLVGDVATKDGRRSILGECGEIDILVTNAGGPPAKAFHELDEEAWHSALDAVMISAIMMIHALVPGMIARKWGRIINITSSAVKAPLPLLHLSNGARSGLVGFVGGLAREIAEHGVTINNLLPGRFETDRLRRYIGSIAARDGIGVDEAARRMAAANPMRRFGQTAEFGAFCTFLASESAAYYTGQNVLLDGGEYPGQ